LLIVLTGYGRHKPALAPFPHPKFKMAVTFTIDHDAKRIIAIASGILSCQEVLDYLKEKQKAQALGFAELFDVRGVTLDLSISDLHKIASSVRAAMGDLKQGRVAVVTNSSFIRGLAQTYAAMTAIENPEFDVFHDLEQARGWAFSGEK
jgi:hypothetical protein